MRGFGRRTWFLLGLGALSVPLAAAAVAYGCTAAATLSPNPGAAATGSVVTVTGKYFGTHDPEDKASNSPVQLRLGSVTGPVLGEGFPAGTDRSFSVQIRIPDSAAVGESFISATQLSATGTPVYGTPARQAFRVLAPAAAGAPGGSAPGAGQPGNTVAPRQLATLSLATARRIAKARIKRSKRSAKAIRTKCVRRNRTTAVCRVKYRLRSKTVTKRVVVRSQSSSARW